MITVQRPVNLSGYRVRGWLSRRAAWPRRAAASGPRGPGPAALGPRELAESGRREEGAVARVVLASGVGSVEPGVVEEAVDVRQPQPAGRLPEQPRRNATPPMRLADAQAADIGPSAVPGQPFSFLERLHLDVADHVLAERGGQAAAIGPHRPAQ